MYRSELVIVKTFLLGIFVGVILCGCAGFAYKYYGLDGVSYQDGKLLGPTADKDRPFSDCSPSTKEQHPCIVMFTPEFKALKKDYEDCGIQLEYCQRTCNGN